MKTMVFLLAGWLAVTAHGETSKPTIFVAPLDGDLAQIQGWQPAMGEGLAEMLITELGKIGKFDVLESTALPELISEIQLGQEGFVAADEKVEKGGFAGADFMFRGKVTRFGSQKKELDLGGFVPRSGGKLGLQQTRADVRIDWRIVDAYNRKVLKTGEAVGAHTGAGFDIGVGVKGHGGGIGFANKEFMNSALGRATVKALESIVADVKAWDVPLSGRQKAKAGKEAQAAAMAAEAQAAVRQVAGKVLAVPAKTVVIVSLGSQHGLKPGDKALVYELIETKDDNGVVVFTEEKLVGEVTLDSVQDDRSKCSYAGNVPLKTGWVVRAK